MIVGETVRPTKKQRRRAAPRPRTIPMMRSNARDKRPRRPDGHKNRPAGGGGGHRTAGGGPHARRFRGGGPGKAPQGPKHCPMCGEVVTNLSQHVRSKHDDATSHPRD
jgi:hypothetical protein